MGADVNEGVGFENLFQISVESRKAVMRRAAFRHQQAHRIVFVAKRRLNTKKDVAEHDSLNQQTAVNRIDCSGRPSPLSFNFFGKRTKAQMFIDVHSISDVGSRTEALRIAVEQL